MYAVLSHFSHVQLFVIPWMAAHQSPLSMGFSRQEHWGGLSCPPPGDLPDPGIEPASPVSPALAGGSCTSATWEALLSVRWWWFSGSVVSDCAAPGTAARQAPLSVGFSRKESWSGLPFPSPLLSVWKAIQTSCKYKKARMKQCRAYIK